VLVCGSREWRRVEPIRERLRALPRGTVVLHGGARGADRIAGVIAAGLGFEVREYPADWKRLGRSAGVRRSAAMLDERPDLVLAFWQDYSSGTGYTLALAERKGIPVEVIR
jgi:hypothetical protein